MSPSVSDSVLCPQSSSVSGICSVSSVSSCRPFLKSKFQIGSVKGPKNFGSNQTVFHRDDVPAARRERKKEVKEWKGRKILPVGKPPGWCSSASLDPSRLKLARIMSNSDQDPGKPYQYNYRAETLPPRSPDPVPRPHMFKVSCITTEEADDRKSRRKAYPDDALDHPKRLAEMPVSRELDDKKTWDPSSQLDGRRRRQAVDEFEAQCKQSTQRRIGKLTAYTTLEQREKEKRDWIRQLKIEGRLWTLKEPEPAPLLPTHNRLASDPIRRVREHRHSGAWEVRESEGCMMWSDTASYEHDSPGDIIRVHNPAGFNFAAPCLTRGPALQ